MPKLYTPAGKRPPLPVPTGQGHHDYLHVAWHMYWKMVRKISRRNKCGLLKAHQKIQLDHPFVVPEIKDDEYWHTDDFLLLFMLQFEEWQFKKYNLDNIRIDGDFGYMDQLSNDAPLVVAFEMLGDARRDDLITELWCRDHWKLVEQMVDDPIYGYQAKAELRTHLMLTEHRIDEVFRRSALPENVRTVDQLIEKLSPSNYSVHFPYPVNPYHNVPNCLCVMADGSPIFRLEVLDPEKCTKFRLAEMMPPWWKDSGLLEPCGPGEGEYDFPFYDLNIVEDDVFDFDKLIEVIERGAEQIGTRAERKWGKQP